MADIEKIERELRENLASFDAEVAYELENDGERADLWTDIDVPVEAIRALLDELSRLREERDEAKRLLEAQIAGHRLSAKQSTQNLIRATRAEGALAKIAAPYDGEDRTRLVPLSELGAELRHRQNIAKDALRESLPTAGGEKL